MVFVASPLSAAETQVDARVTLGLRALFVLVDRCTPTSPCARCFVELPLTMMGRVVIKLFVVVCYCESVFIAKLRLSRDSRG
jgi:hypothetical protein